MKQTFKVTADLQENRLQITLNGVLRKDDLTAVFTEIRFCVADLKPGFEVISDYTNCKLGHLTGLATFAKIRDYLCTKELGTVVRIARKSQLIFRQLSRISDKKYNARVIYVSTLAEAENRLAEVAVNRGIS